MASLQVRNARRPVANRQAVVCVACAMTCALSITAHAAVYTCTINGRTVYQDIACPPPPLSKPYVEQAAVSAIARDDFRRLTARPSPVLSGKATLSTSMAARLVALVQQRTDARTETQRLQANLRAAALAALADPSTPGGAAIARDAQAALQRLRPQADANQQDADAIARHIATLCPHGLVSMPGRLVCD